MAVTFISLLMVGLSPVGDPGTGALSVWLTAVAPALRMGLCAETHSFKAAFVEGDKERQRSAGNCEHEAQLRGPGKNPTIGDAGAQM